MIAKSQHLKLNSRNISETIKNRKYSKESNSQSNSRGYTGGTSRSFKQSRNPLGTWGTSSTCITLLSSFSRGSLWSLGANRTLCCKRTCFTFLSTCTPWVLEVIPQHSLDLRVSGFPGFRGFQLHNAKCIYKI